MKGHHWNLVESFDTLDCYLLAIMIYFAKNFLIIGITFNILRIKFTFEHLYKFMKPLGIDEIIYYLDNRWGRKYDFRLFKRKDYLYFQMMWKYLEQESFPMSETEYKESIAAKIEVLNRGGYSDEVRKWLQTVKLKPRLGRAVSLQLEINEKMREFLL